LFEQDEEPLQENIWFRPKGIEIVDRVFPTVEHMPVEVS
jgi:hypothetical protein